MSPHPSSLNPTRSHLLRLLSEACELEHSLACSYLFSAFTLKQDISEGISWEELQKTRLWAGQIYFVASEEMLHLAQVWNLLAAVGGSPYYLRPNFPTPAKYFPLDKRVELLPFGVTALERFLFYERPQSVDEAAEESHRGEYGTVGELYRRIAALISDIPEDTLFIGNPTNQVGPELVHFPGLIKVQNRESALAAIHHITEQGEGTSQDRDDCHYGIFRRIYQSISESGNSYARQVVANPTTPDLHNYDSGTGTVVTYPPALQVMDLFDSVYGLMMRLLQYVFDNSTSDAALLTAFAESAIGTMTRVLKPLGEAATFLPAHGSRHPGQAGPAFGMTRHVPLPLPPRIAYTVASERWAELVQEAERLSQIPGMPAQMHHAAVNLAEMRPAI